MDQNLNGKSVSRENLNNKIQLKEYSSPKLERLGDLRSLTLGISGGSGESGGSLTRFDAFPPPPTPTPFV